MAIIHTPINFMCKSIAFGLNMLLASGYCAAEPFASSGSILLSELAASSDINNVAVSQDGKQACIVASYVRERDAAVHSTVTLLDLIQRKASWTKQIAPPDGSANIYAVACRFHGDKLFTLANADSSRTMANNRSRVYVLELARNGDQLEQAAIPVLADSRIAIDMLVYGDRLHVIGYGKDTDANSEYYSMFISEFDEKLAFQTRVTKDGSYTQFSAVRAIADNLYIGGEFLPKIVAKTDLPIEYANSKLKPGAGYRWSVRPQHKVFTRSENIATAIDDKATVYSLSQSKGTSSIIAVDANGKAATAKTFNSSFCKVDSLTSAGSGLLGIRRSCAGTGRERAVVWIDPSVGTEQVLELLGKMPKFITSSDGNWYGISGNDRKLEFSSGKLERQYWHSLMKTR